MPAQLIARYATGAIVKEVEAGYLAFHAELDRQKLPRCPFPLVFYFLKFDPEFGERELRKAFATGPCYDMGTAFESLGSYAMSPALERMAIVAERTEPAREVKLEITILHGKATKIAKLLSGFSAYPHKFLAGATQLDEKEVWPTLLRRIFWYFRGGKPQTEGAASPILAG